MDNAPPPNPSQFTPAKSTFVASSSTYTAARASVASFILVSRFHRGVSTPTPRPARILVSHLQHRPRRPEPFPRARHSRLRPTAALSSVFPFVVARRPSSNRPSSRRVTFEIRSVVRSHRSRRSHHRARRDDRVAHARRAARRSSSRRSRVASHRFVVRHVAMCRPSSVRHPRTHHAFDPVARRRCRPTDRPIDRSMRCDG